MDERDHRLVELLQLDGRASNAKIALERGISEGTVRHRLSRLIQEDGVFCPTPRKGIFQGLGVIR